MEDKPEYCGKCGSKLVESKRNDGFDVKTGLQEYEMRLQCPKTFDFWMNFGHTNYKQSCLGYWYQPSE